MSLALPSEGGCQCGEIRYRLTGEPGWLAVCHCNDCKMQSGGVFGMSLRMREADVKLISGEPKCWTRPSENGGRAKDCYFCRTCGIRLWHTGGSGFLSIKPGTLDDSSLLAPRYEGWTKRKAPWLTIDGLEFKPELAKLLAYPQKKMDEMALFSPDWAYVNANRAAWIERYNQIFVQ